MKKYAFSELDGLTMPVQQFLEDINEIPYWKIIAGYHYITVSELREKYYDKNVLIYNDPKDFGVDDEGHSDSFDRLYVEVIL